ncbi:heterokaryon incompatibility protein-domain-containing protein [Fusarium redolens]|uniref:Heterokaryon incompatibility protein-domain-containing protein n=1 Tax=Fusarium redolens TaxID=48865 RepID=A0A9P9G058_FUSRE|nr:heterokaryon incompatibility protein-domain-containing protein [Fusarium redolens]KAH7230086.1 heterokaryon incompatibility protein-domain-containing protein [Fusarium redolens]
MLCSKCKGCLQTEACLTTAQACHSLAHHQTYQSLEQAIDAGCYICNRFWEALSAQEHVLLSSTVGEGVEPSGAYCAIESVQHYLTSTSLDDGKSYGHPGCYLLQVAYNKPAITTCFRASFLLEPVECANTNLARQSLAQSTQSPETLSLAKDWVRECTAHHERCKTPVGEKPWYPTRLLSFDLPEASIVRLLETDQTTPVGQYMTLTHRWGPVDHIILTKETYPQLLEGLPLSTLPQLFRDAVSICRHLGVGYIWIDSLCIFQGKDNIGDWQHEASLMKNVYSNSFCNISAADTPNCSQSIFNSRDPRLLNPQVVELTLCGEGSAKITESFVLSDYRFWKSEVSNALVNKRGWVLQERFLAPRILHFSRRQLIWECCEKDAAEVYPDGLPLALSTSSDARFKQMDSSDYTGRVGRYKYREADASALTVPSDKLIACSGIAKRVAEIVQDDYVAGMWRRYLEGELLWMVQGNHQPGRWTRPREYRAPSWSWASIDGPITPGEPRIQDSLITVEDYHLDYWTSDKTAAIRGGWLRLRGVLKKTTLARKSSTPGGGYHWDMMLDNERVNVLEEASPGNTEPRVMLDILQEDFKEENTKGLLFSMCARSKTGDGRENLESIYDVWVAMLQKSTLPSSMASNDPRISLVLQDLAEESENTDVALSRLASVQLVAAPNKKKNQIIINSRLTSRDLNVSNKTLDELAAEIYGRYPAELIQAAEYMTRVGESGKEIDAAEKRVHLEKLKVLARSVPGMSSELAMHNLDVESPVVGKIRKKQEVCV